MVMCYSVAQEQGLDLIIADWHLANRTGMLLSTPLDGTMTNDTEGWVMRLSKSQIDEFSAHIQHRFGQSKMVVRFLLLK